MSGDIHETALRMLARRALSMREVAERLERRGFSGAAAAAEVGRLQRAGLVNDAAVAGAVVAWEIGRGRGRRAVAASLCRRRLDAEAIREAMEAFSDEDELAGLGRALAAAGRRYPGWRRLPEERRKVVRYLLARGFGACLVRDAVAAARKGDVSDAADVEPGDPAELS